jgi:hypothetical protein
MDHRWGSRQTLKQPVEVESAPKCLGKAWLTDVSLTGAHLQCDEQFRGSICVRVRLSNGRGSKGEWLDAHVARRTPDGLGLEWFEFSPQPIAKLLNGKSNGHTR